MASLSGSRAARLEAETALHGRFVTIQNKWSHRFIDVDNASHDNGAGVNLWAGDRSANEQWQLEQQPNGAFSMFARHSGKCLDLHQWSLDDAAGIVQWDWENGVNQQWWVASLDDGSFRIMSVHSGKVLDGTWDEGNWSQLVQWQWHGGDNQRWLISIVE